MNREERIERSSVHYNENVYQVVQDHTHRDLVIDDIDFNTFRGSSAGMMLSLYLIQEADGVDLTHGKKIVGTGAVDAQGNIIPVGGIKEKVQSAEQNDADVFLVPQGSNEREARETAQRLNADFEIVAVRHIDEALSFLKKLKPLPPQ